MNIKILRTVMPIIVISLIIIGITIIGVSNRILKNRGAVETTGYLEAVEIDVKPMVSGRLLSVPVEEGDEIVAGDIVALIDGESLDATYAGADAQRKAAADAVTAARTAYGQAHRDVIRLEKLTSKTSVSEMQLDQTRTQRNVALAQLRAAESNLEAATANVALVESQRKEIKVYAPRDGTVLSRNFEEGELVSPAKPIITIAKLSEMEIEVYVPENYIGLIDYDDPVEIGVDYFPSKKYPGKVKRIATKAEFTPRNVQSKKERVNLVFKVTVEVPNPEGELKPGVPCDITFPEARKEDMKKGEQ